MKPLLLLVLLVAAPAASAQTGCTAGDCTDGAGTFVTGDGDV